MSLEHSPAKSVRGYRPAKSVPRYRRTEASAYLKEVWGISRTPKTLAKLAVIGGGPLIEYDGRTPLYTGPNLDEYGRKALSPPVASTSERREQQADA
jgi:hypothetical protein